MATAVRFDTTGAPDVLTLKETASLAPGPDEVWLEQAAIGVNFLDVTQREGGGHAAAVGSNVSNVSVGDRVAYAMGPIGSYASSRLFPPSA